MQPSVGSRRTGPTTCAVFMGFSRETPTSGTRKGMIGGDTGHLRDGSRTGVTGAEHGGKKVCRREVKGSGDTPHLASGKDEYTENRGVCNSRYRGESGLFQV